MIECCINLCPSNSSDGEVSFYRFPVIRSDGNRQSSIERRSAWIRVVGRKNIDWDLAVVCSRHFASGRPSQLYEQDSTDWIPSLELKGEGLKRVRKVVVVEPIRASPAVAVRENEPAPLDAAEQSILGSLLLARSTNPPVSKAVPKDPIEETIRNNSTKICRLCLDKEVRLTRPFQDDSGPDDSLLQKIYECTTVKITLKASYPASICAICDSKLSEYSKFREKCIENDELLRTILDGGDNACQKEEGDILDVAPVEAKEESPVDDAPNAASIQPLEYHESTEIRDLQLQLYGSSDENTVSQSEFTGSEAVPVAPLPKITSVTSNASIGTDASPSVVPIRATSPAVVDAAPEPEGVAATPSPKPTISVKPLSSLAAATSVVSPEPAASDSVGSSAPKETDKALVPANYMPDGRLECTICARPFRNSYTLRRHMNLHTEENLYTCEYCGKKFNDRSNWKIHLRAHTGDNLLRCVICFKTFISPSTLKYHLRAHRKLKVFECKFCVETTTTYETLADHIAAKHGDIRLEDYAKFSEESFLAGDFLKIEMEADETTLTVTVPRSSNAESSEVGSETTLQLPPLTPAPPPGAAASVSQSKDSTDEAAVKIKEEIPDPDEIEIKQEPLDDDGLGSMGLDAGHTQVQQQLTALIPPADEQESPPVILFRCDYCMKIFKYLYELRVHMRIHNGAKVTEKASPVKPPPAKKPRHPSIDEDVGELANAPLPEHECDKCEKSFRTEELLRVHIETHKMDQDVTMARQCKICFKIFKCELNLVSHMRKHHRFETYVSDQQQQEQEQGQPQKAAPVEEKPQSPDSSSNEGGNQSQGESVDTSSTAEGGGSNITRKCEICALAFDCAYKLEQHMMTHFKNNEAVAFVPSADRPYKCTECHKRFKRKDYLLIHIRTHTGERRHKCDMCSSAFVHPSNLITHRKLHSNERPFKCDLCPAAFKLFAGLKIHRKRCVLKYLQENSVTVAD